jgi:hypothetical protein
MSQDAIHQCPRCELRFQSENELADHLAVDHRQRPSTSGEDHSDPPAPS